MKRRSVKTARAEDSAPSGRSSYGQKRASGNMMYGPGCCAHKVTPERIAAAKREAHERGHFAARGSAWLLGEFTSPGGAA